MGWCDHNPATKIKKPIVKSAPVIPFTPDEYKNILSAIDRDPTKNNQGYDVRRRLRAFICVLRYTAFRISDAVKLKKSVVVNGRVLIRTQKTEATVHLPLPKFVLAELKSVGNEKYYFWSGNGKLNSAKSVWQRSLSRLFTLAKVLDTHICSAT